MKKIIAFMGVSFISTMLFSQTPNNMTAYDQAANRCQDLRCVRSNIDIIDSQIVTLIGQRLAYVRRAGELKTTGEESPRPLHDRDRETAIILKVGDEAAAVGYPPFIARAIYSTILSESNLYEFRYINDKFLRLKTDN